MCHCCVHHWLSAPLTLNYLVGPGSVPLSLVSCHTLGSYIPLHHETIEYYWRQICEGQNKDSVEEVLRYARRPDNLQMSMTIPTNVILYNTYMELNPFPLLYKTRVSPGFPFQDSFLQFQKKKAEKEA